MSTKVVTRFAPSPTGFPHLGTAMYALLNYVYARQNNGKVIMRSEDTDPTRSKPEFEAAIKDDLKWLGIEADEFARQTDRLDIYKAYIQKLIESDKAYISNEKKINEDGSEGPVRDVVRLRNQNKIVTFTDMARGEISVDTTDLKDFVIARDINSPLYHLTVVVDDFEMGVTHIIRGEDGIANTPRQILIQEAIGAPRPIYAHYPFVLGANRQKMGKRNGAVGIREYRKQGYLPEAVLNFCLLLVWHPKDDREMFTLSEIIEHFELERIGKSGAILDPVKLDWFNREYMKLLSEDELTKRALTYCSTLGVEQPGISRYIPMLLERIDKFGDIPVLLGKTEKTETNQAKWGELDFLLNAPAVTKELLIGKSGAIEHEIKQHLEWIMSNGTNREVVWPYAEQNGKGKVLWPMRVALSGKEKSPDPFALVTMLGNDESRARIRLALDVLK